MTPPTMRILQFSDIHLGRFPNGFSWLLDKRLLGTSTQFLRRRHKQDFTAVQTLTALAEELAPNLILCTGDITAIAAPNEFKAACDILAPLTHIHNADFLYIPGNHDAYTARQDTVSARKNAMAFLNAHTLHDAALSEITYNGIRLFALDAASPMPPWRSAGIAQESALRELEARLLAPRKPDETRILIAHFPVFSPNGQRLPWRRRMDGDLALQRLIQRNLLDMLLCGHIHTPFVHTENNGAFTQICPGSLTLHHHAAVIDINPLNMTMSSRLVDLKSLN